MDEPHIRELLALSVGFPTTETLTRLARLYANEPARHVLGIELDGAVVGLLRLHAEADGRAEILHLAVAPGRRGTGLATLLLNEAISRCRPTTLVAETNAGAVGCYRRHGFAIESLSSERYGVGRFRCVLVVQQNSC